MVKEKQKEIKNKLLSALSNLDPKKLKTVHEIAQETGLHINTVKDNIDEIVLIQDLQKIEVFETKSQTLIRLNKKEENYSDVIANQNKMMEILNNILKTVKGKKL